MAGEKPQDQPLSRPQLNHKHHKILPNQSNIFHNQNHQIILIQPFGQHPKQGIKSQHYHPKPSTNDPTKSTHHNPIKSKIPKINQQTLIPQ
jgi:hypothetical protein